VILLSKSDLASKEAIEAVKANVFDVAPHTEVIEFSNVNPASVEAVKKVLTPGQTYCLLGSSGVGKTTLLNSLLGEEAFETKTVSKVQSKGRHTTTSRQLVRLENGAMIIDTPGMRELGGFAIEEGLDETFAEIIELVRRCKFSNCTHTNEKGCAVLSAIESGELPEQRYRNYLKLKQETAFNEMSYLEKRKKDKRFGKMVKDVMKEKQSRKR
jgi:ribosome biogenesis GTPase